ncbi:MAG: hypothetical protein H7Y05_09535 [Steroidobacteraceae bacterium]|nr:hypothetical protein [Deltaproteobacteria bacterium]
MIRYMIMAVAALLIGHSTGWAAETKAAFTQKDFVRLMFQQFSWGEGLSREPADRDYLQILGGKRKFRYEAENAFNEKTDRVTVREFALYGPFTGKGWLMGVSDSTEANFTTLVPIKGIYTLKAVIKGNGFIWKIDNHDHRADSNSDKFREIEIGKIPLKAGVVKIQVSIPPEGAIDSFSFSAADHAAIQPVDGWRFREALTAGRLAEIVVSITGRQEQLPESPQDPPRQLAVFETAIIPSTAAKTDAAEFGKSSSREWIRADYRGATVQVPVRVTKAGFYVINAVLMGGLVTGSVNDVPFEVSARPYLDRLRLGLFRLESGDNPVMIDLPPMGGVDTLELRKKSMTPEDFLKLSGIKGPPERLIMADEANAVLKTILDSYPVRK